MPVCPFLDEGTVNARATSNLRGGQPSKNHQQSEMTMTDFWQYVKTVRKEPTEIPMDHVPMFHGRLYAAAELLWIYKDAALRAQQAWNDTDADRDESSDENSWEEEDSHSEFSD